MQVEFRECNWSDLWIWIEFTNVPSEGEKQYVEQVLDSWYTVGMLGGYNATSMSVQDEGLDISYMNYDSDAEQLPSLMHNMGNAEYEAQWGRCWFDLGTADAMALDILINAMNRLSLEYVGIERIVIGGQGDDWPVPINEEAHSAHLN
ncbi:MAG: DUF3531 family protein [Cyanobacteria bacterium P01_E01_bin.34]